MTDHHPSFVGCMTVGIRLVYIKHIWCREIFLFKQPTYQRDQPLSRVAKRVWIEFTLRIMRPARNIEHNGKSFDN